MMTIVTLKDDGFTLSVLEIRGVMTDNLVERARELLPDESEWEGFAIIEQMADRIEALEAAHKKIIELALRVSDPNLRVMASAFIVVSRQALDGNNV